jgi:Domain of unknown function (4846)
MSKTGHKLLITVLIAILTGMMTLVATTGFAAKTNRLGWVQSPSLKRPDPNYPWPAAKTGEPLERRIKPPKGFRRIAVPQGSFADWLRRLPLKPGNPQLLLHTGNPKTNQKAHHAIVAIDVGKKNLQQCADAIIRLRAEFCEASVAKTG